VKLKIHAFITAAIMPLTQREAVQLALLILSVPVQYFLMGTVRPQTLSQLKHLQDVWFKLEAWKARWLRFVSWMLRGKTSAHNISLLPLLFLYAWLNCQFYTFTISMFVEQPLAACSLPVFFMQLPEANGACEM
jgi:hypothetical protein